jgi:iron complex outermembrane recepter protein
MLPIFSMYIALTAKAANIGHKKARLRDYIVLCVLGLSAVANSSAFAADRPEPTLHRIVIFDIKRGSLLEDALIQCGIQAGVEVMMDSSIIPQRLTSGVQGALSIEKAISMLLSDSGLTYTVSGNRIRIAQEGSLVRSSLKKVGPIFDTATADRGSPRAELYEDDNESKQRRLVDEVAEVVVTAQKREERIQDVPIPVTSINTDKLLENNQVSFSDYYNQIPGLTIAPSVISQTNITIRGISTGPNISATVAVLIDDIPFGGTGSPIIPDLDPGDLSRVEVLRGPQGTLYGASSLGGLVKYVTKDPSESFSGRAEASTDVVQNADSLGYGLRTAITGPLSSDLFARLSAFTRRDAGYIDDSITGARSINETYANGGRVALMWRPSEGFSAKLSALFQQLWAATPGTEVIGAGLGDLQQNFPGETPFRRRDGALSAVLHATVGSFDVTSLTGYNFLFSRDTFDLSGALGSFNQSFYGQAYSGARAPNYNNVRKFTQEVRVASSFGELLDARVGLFFTYEKNHFTQGIEAVSSPEGVVAATGYFQAGPDGGYREYAAFSDFTFHVTKDLSIQIGGRINKDRVWANEFLTYTDPAYTELFFGAGAPNVTPSPAISSTANPFTFLFAPEYRWSSNVMTYIRVDTGFRPGGANSPGPEIPNQFGPDKTTNYEVGTKGEFLDRRISVDTSLYYIDWRNIQLGLTAPNGFGYTGNGGNAKSRGLELSTEVRPFQGTEISAWADWARANITSLPQGLSPFSQLNGSIGQQLPYAPRFSSNFSITQNASLSTDLDVFVGLTLRYMGDRKDQFDGLIPGTSVLAYRQDLPAYAQLDGKFGFRAGGWNVSLFANNVTNRRGFISGGASPGNLNGGPMYILTPRMIGASVARTF